MWALWGVFDFWLARADASAKEIFDRGVETLLRNLARFDTGYWSLYEQSGTNNRNPAENAGQPFLSPLAYRTVASNVEVDRRPRFAAVADRWEGYAQRRGNRTRALVEKSIFKLLHY